MAQLALPALLLAAGAAWAKPPGPTADPRVSGHERSPIEREFHESGVVRTISYFQPADIEKSGHPLPVAAWLKWLQERLEHGLTIPLGTVDVAN
jgi:hypothetical protein